MNRIKHLMLNIRLWLIHKLGGVTKERFSILELEADQLAQERDEYKKQLGEYKEKNTKFVECKHTQVQTKVLTKNMYYDEFACRGVPVERLREAAYCDFVNALAISEEFKNAVRIEERIGGADMLDCKREFRCTICVGVE